VRLQLNY